jgi:hypothetical protein
VQRDLGVAVADVPGSGAAGGMGAAMLAFLGARLRPGIDIVMQAVGLAGRVADADLVITGEGRIDSQTVHGKTPIGVARVAKRHGKPVIGIAGCLAADAAVVHAHGIDAVFSVIYRPCTVEEALRDAAVNVEMAARNIAATLKVGVIAAGCDLDHRDGGQAVGSATAGGVGRVPVPRAGIESRRAAVPATAVTRRIAHVQCPARRRRSRLPKRATASARA